MENEMEGCVVQVWWGMTRTRTKRSKRRASKAREEWRPMQCKRARRGRLNNKGRLHSHNYQKLLEAIYSYNRQGPPSLAVLAPVVRACAPCASSPCPRDYIQRDTKIMPRYSYNRHLRHCKTLQALQRQYIGERGMSNHLHRFYPQAPCAMHP